MLAARYRETLQFDKVENGEPYKYPEAARETMEKKKKKKKASLLRNGGVLQTLRK